MTGTDRWHDAGEVAEHRFKGLERAVIVLVELRPDDERLDQHLNVGASRARQHLVVIAPGAVLERLS